jgi:bacterial/archaeal transporter family protein
MQFFSTWQGLALCSALCAALTAIFGKLGVAGMNSDLATFIRTIIILGVTALIITARGVWGATGDIAWKGVAFLVLSGVATGFSWLFYYRALQIGPASQVAPLEKISVAFTVILAVLFLGETLTLRVAMGGGLVVAGAVILAWK